MGLLFKTSVMFLSFTPLWITILIMNIVSLAQNSKCIFVERVWAIILPLSLLVALKFFLWCINKIKSGSKYPYQLLSAKHERGFTSEFLLSYILPLFVFDVTQWSGTLYFLIYFFVLSFLCVRNNNIYANIVLELMGYRFFSCTVQKLPIGNEGPSDVIIISREPLCSMTGIRIIIDSIGKPFYISL